MVGIEYAVHGICQKFDSPETDVVLHVDTSNAFNSLNRGAALHNIRFKCSPLSTILINTYREASELLIDGEVTFSMEGTTQGDLLAMAMYAIGSLPMIRRLSNSVTQVWYADNVAAIGSLVNLRDWWNDLARIGPSYGYFSNPAKSWLITKEACHANALTTFDGTNINISCSGHSYLDSPLGSSTFVDNFVSEKIGQWSKELHLLTAIVQTQPHAAFTALTHGLSSKLSYLYRTTAGLSSHFLKLEDLLCFQLIPALTGNPAPDDIDRQLFALPVREGV